MSKQLTFMDFFSGIGGFRLGLERAGFKCVGYCDCDNYANKLYKSFFDTSEELFLMTFEKSKQKNCRISTSCVQDFLVNLFQLLGKGEDLTTPEAQCF